MYKRTSIALERYYGGLGHDIEFGAMCFSHLAIRIYIDPYFIIVLIVF